MVQQQEDYQKPYGQLWPPTHHETVPAVFESAAQFGEIAPGGVASANIPMPSNRLYGTLVAIEGAAAGAELEVTLWGTLDPDSFELGRQQYTGTAKQENGFRDPYQQWRYRDFMGLRIIRLQVRNVGQVATSFTAKIEGEPF